MRARLRLRTDLAEVVRADAWLVKVCRDADVPQEIVQDLELALDETVSNVIRHGYGVGAPGEIEVAVEVGADRVGLEIRDRARPFNPLVEVPEPDLFARIEERPRGGLGVYLVRQVMDRVDYSYEKGENRLILERVTARKASERPTPPSTGGGSRASMDFTIKVDRKKEPGRGPATVVTFAGRLDSVSAPRAEQEISLVLAGNPEVLIFDLGQLRYISSDGLRVLLGPRQHQARHGGQYYLTNLQPQIEKVLEIVKALPGLAAFRSDKELDAYLAAIQRKVKEGD